MKKSAITLLIFLIMIISVSAVSAADDASDLGASDDATISVANTDTAVTAGKEVKNFTELNNEILDHSGSSFTLSSDYKRNTTENDMITIGTSMVIDGNNSIINGTTTANVEIFHIANGASVTLKNMVLYNTGYVFITQETGTSLTLENIIFNGDEIGIVSDGVLNVKNCVYNNNHIGSMLLFENATLTSPSTINVTANCNPWNQINYVAIAYDDKGNKIFIDDDVAWTVDINNGKVTKKGDGNISDSVDAKVYGQQVISATNTVLTNPTINTATVIVTPGKQQSNITITVNPTAPAWGDEVNVTVTIDSYNDATVGVLYPSGKVNLTINGGTPIPKDLVNGSAVFTIPTIAAGPCTLIASYGGDDFYNANYTTKTFNVAKKVPMINITVDNSTVGKPVINVILPSDATGYVNITVVGTTQQKINAELVAGRTSFTATLDAKDTPYNVTVKYTPATTESNYAAATNSTNFTTAKLTSKITIAVENITYGNNASFTITLADGIKNATVVVTNVATAKKEYDKTVNLTSGSKTITLPVIAAGKYNITVTSADNDPVYRVSTNSTLFEVKQIKSNIEITTGAYVLFENVTVTVTVNNNKNGTVELSDGTKVIGTKPLDKNGVVNFTIPAITVGKHNITAEFTSDNKNYTSGNKTIAIDVAKLTPKITVVLDGRVNAGQNAKINVTLTNNGTANAPTGKISISMGGVPITDGTLDKGAVQILVPTTAVGQYTIDVFYKDGDKNYTANNVTFKFEVTKFDVELKVDVENFTVDQDVKLNVTAVTTGTVAFTNPFTVEVIGKNNDLINSTTVVLSPNTLKSLTYKLPAGEYTLKVTYAGDDVYSGNTTTSKAFVVKDIIRNLTIDIKNVTYPGKAVAVVNASVNGNYNVTVNGKSYTVKVENGIGQTELDVLAPNKYTATVISLVKGYETANNSTNFTVKKGNTTATLTIANVTYPANATAVVVSNVDGVYNITNAANVVIANVTVKNGNGNVVLPVVGAGTYTYKLVAPVNANYTAPTKEINATFKVNKGTIDVSASVDVVKYPNKPIVKVTSSVDGVYKVFVNGLEVTGKTVTVVNHTGNVTLDDRDYTPKTYFVEVKMDNANYTQAKANATITVQKGDLKYNVTFTNLVYDGVHDVTGTLNTVVPTTDKGYQIFLEGKNVTKVNGGEAFDLGKLAAGEYTVKVVPNATDSAFAYYNVNNYTTTFTVETGSISLTINVTNLVYPAPVKVNITTNVAANYTVTAGTISKEVNLTAGENIVDMGILPVGAYTATVTSKNANYTTTTNSTTFRVTYGDIVATIDIPTVAYGTQPVAIINSTATGTFYVIVNGKSYSVNVKNGTGNVTLDKETFYVGTYTAEWGADLSEYNPFIGTPKTFTVKQATVNLTIEVTTVKYPNQAVATVYANIPGVYKVTVEGYSYNVTVDATGSKTQTIDLLAVKDGYVAKVNVSEINGNYTAKEASATFNVTIGTPVINIDVKDTYQVLDNVTLEITVPYGTGKLNITDTFTGKNDLVSLVNSTYKYNITNVKGYGQHIIYVELQGDHNFTDDINTAKFNVTPIYTGFIITDNNAVYENNAVITVNMTGLVNGTAPTGAITIPGYPAKAANKTVAFDLGKLAAGVYSVNITYAGDAYYAPYWEVYSFTVEKFTPAVNATSTGATYPDNATVTFSSNRTGNFTIDVVDAKGNVQTIKVGIVANNTKKVVQIAGLDAGKYTAKVNYLGDENYTAVTANTTFTIIKEAAELNATVIPATYPAKATVEVIATQSGSCTIVVTDKNGKVVDTKIGSLVANVTTSVVLGQIDAGDYKVNVTYESTNFGAASVVKDLTISKGAPIIAVVGIGATYPDTGVVEFMSSAAGDYTVTIGTFTTTGTFAAYELVTIDVPQLGAGEYDVVVDYAENANYNATTATGSFVIAKGTPDIFIDVNTVLIGENATVIVVIDNATGIVTINGNNVELVDGFATYNIGILKAETYDITAVYGGDANFTVGNETLTFTVSRLPANLAIAATNTTYGTSPVVTITLDDKSDAIVRLYLNGKEAIVEVKNGSYINKLATPYGLAAGEYNLTAVYKQTDMFEADTATTFITIAKAEVHMTINASDVTYPNDAVVTVMSDVDGVYSVFVDPTGPSQNVTLKANVPQEVTFSGLAVGEHEACIDFAGNENYTDPIIEIAVFNVLAAPININIDVANVTYPDDVVAYVSSDVAGKYTIAISGSTTTQTIDVVAGEATKVVFAELDAGDYTITASYADTENYTGTTKTADVTVAKADVHMTITADNVTYPATVYVTVSSDVTGDYSVYVDPWGIAQNITLKAGESRILAFTGLEAGEHEVCIEYDGSKNYNEDIEFAVFNVLKAPITVTVAADDVTYPADVVVTVTADVAGDYNFTFDDTTQTITLEANVAKVITKSGLTAGTYDITVARAESDNYTAVTQTASVTVAKSANTTMTIEATSPLAGENATITVTLPADATGTVAVKYGNGVYTADVVKGVATVSVPTNVAGTQTAAIAYSGDNNYAPASDSVQITVKPNGIIIAENIKRGVNSPYDYYATLVDGNNNPVSGVEITFTIAGKTYKATTNASGIATVSAGLGLVDDKDTKYDVIVTNPFTLENTTGSTTIVPRLIVISGDLTADYLENPPYIVQAIGDDGNPVGAGETVKVVFAGFYYDMLTNATGHVVRTIGLAPGMYAVKACYQGYNTTATVFTVKQVMKVTSGTLKKTAKSYTLKATLKSSNGKALVGKEVSLTFNGKTYNVKTNSKGVASYTIKSSVISKLTAGKTYTLKAKYVNDVRKGKIKVVSK